MKPEETPQQQVAKLVTAFTVAVAKAGTATKAELYTAVHASLGIELFEAILKAAIDNGYLTMDKNNVLTVTEKSHEQMKDLQQ